MTAELIHIECGIFNGIAIYRLSDKILGFELGTPHYCSGEYRVSAPIKSDYSTKIDILKVLPFDEEYVGYVPTNLETSIELSEEVASWWLKENQVVSEDKDWDMAGLTDDDDSFIIYDKEWKGYSDWAKEQHEPYEDFLFKVLNVFYHWYKSDDCKPSGD